MGRMSWFIGGLLLVGGCKVVDAPEKFEDLVRFGFVHFDDEAEYPTTVVTRLGPMMDKHAEELVEGFRVNELREKDLNAAGVPTELESEIVGMAGTVHMHNNLDDFAWAWAQEDMTKVAGSTLEFRIDEKEGSKSCFLSHECESYSFDGWRQNDLGMFGTSEQTFHRDYRWATTEDGEEVLTIRDMIPDETDISSALFKIHHQFVYTVVFETNKGTERLDTFWIDAEIIGMDVPDSMALKQTIKGMQNTAEAVDEFIDQNR